MKEAGFAPAVGPDAGLLAQRLVSDVAACTWEKAAIINRRWTIGWL